MSQYTKPWPKPEKVTKPKRKGIRPVSLTNTSLCSNGERVTNGQIKSRLSEAYKLKRAKQQTTHCEGFEGKGAAGFAHIIAQARCKQIGKTELIWDLDNFFPASFEANAAIENPKGVETWIKLKNIDHCLEFIRLHDEELSMKFSVAMEGLAMKKESCVG